MGWIEFQENAIDHYNQNDALQQGIDNFKKGAMVALLSSTPWGSVMDSIVLILAAFLFVSTIGLACLLNQLKED
jgi:preprotein translocase subunit SecG